MLLLFMTLPRALPMLTFVTFGSLHWVAACGDEKPRPSVIVQGSSQETSVQASGKDTRDSSEEGDAQSERLGDPNQSASEKLTEALRRRPTQPPGSSAEERSSADAVGAPQSGPLLPAANEAQTESGLCFVRLRKCNVPLPVATIDGEGWFPDGLETAHRSADLCQKRALDYALWCQLTTDERAEARYVAGGKVLREASASSQNH